jgi:hypothetical protein
MEPTIEVLPAVPPRKLTLNDLLTMIRAVDDAIVELPEAELGGYLLQLQWKVDDYRAFLTTIDDRTDRLERDIDALRTAKKSLEGLGSRVRSHLCNTMTEHGVKKMQGETWSVSVCSRDVLIPVDERPSQDEAIMFPDFVRTKFSYEWNKEALKEAVENSNAEAMNLACIQQSKHVRFSARKGEK